MRVAPGQEHLSHSRAEDLVASRGTESSTCRPPALADVVATQSRRMAQSIRRATSAGGKPTRLATSANSSRRVVEMRSRRQALRASASRRSANPARVWLATSPGAPDGPQSARVSRDTATSEPPLPPRRIPLARSAPTARLRPAFATIVAATGTGGMSCVLLATTSAQFPELGEVIPASISRPTALFRTTSWSTGAARPTGRFTAPRHASSSPDRHGWHVSIRRHSRAA
jgi:hypothetical protein